MQPAMRKECVAPYCLLLQGQSEYFHAKLLLAIHWAASLAVAHVLRRWGWVQEHTARAFWHLAVADSDTVFEAVTERSGLVALLKLAAPEVTTWRTTGTPGAAPALRRP